MLYALHRFSGTDDRYVSILLQIQQMGIAGDDEISLCCECAGQHRIVGWVAGNRLVDLRGHGQLHQRRIAFK